MRIASLLPGATELLFALGLGKSIVGVSHDCDHPRDASFLPVLTATNVDVAANSAAIDSQVQRRAGAERPLYQLNEHRIAELAPDLIVTQAQCDVCAVSLREVDQLVATRPALCSTEVFAFEPQSLSELMVEAHRLGAATDRIAAAERLCRQMADRASRVAEGVRRLRRPRVACVEWIEPLMIAGNWVPELVEMAGGEPVMAAGREPSRYREWSDLMAHKPQVGIIAPCGFDLPRSLIELEQVEVGGWHLLLDNSECRTFLLDGNAYLNRMGPRLVDTLEIMAHLFHPENFERPQLDGFERLLAR